MSRLEIKTKNNCFLIYFNFQLSRLLKYNSTFFYISKIMLIELRAISFINIHVNIFGISCRLSECIIFSIIKTRKKIIVLLAISPQTINCVDTSLKLQTNFSRQWCVGFEHTKNNVGALGLH
jgi:hypothetical protein